MTTGHAERVLRVLAIATVALPTALFAGVAWLSWHEQFATAREDLTRAVAINREHASKVFEVMELVAAQIGESVRGRSDTEIHFDERVHRQLKSFADHYDHVLNVFVIGSNGQTLASAISFPSTTTVSASDREYFTVFREGRLTGRQVHVSAVLRGRVTGQLYFQITRLRPNDNPDAFDGITAVAVDPTYFEHFYREASAGRFGAMGLTREDGSLLARFPPAATPLDQIPASAAFVRAVRDRPLKGFIEVVSPIEGVERINAYARLPDHPVYVTATIDRSAVVDTWLMAMARHLIFGAPATLALLTLTVVALHYTRKGNQTLADLRAEVARREAAELQLRQAQKMEAVGRLTGGIAHDFNNLLTVITGSLETLRDRLPDADPRIERSIDNAMIGALRAASLTHRLLAFSRQQPLDPAPVDVNRLVASMSEMLRRTLGEPIAVEAVLANGLWRAHVDPNQLESAILNLAVNARDAMRDGGKLTIATSNAELDADYAAAHEQVTAGPYVQIAVSDTGAGMTPDVLAKAFEPFFTTKPAGHGTGLGLSQVYGFIKQSGGHVAIHSEIDKGTTVRLYLPRLAAGADEDEATGAESAAPARAVAAGHAVLVVEDDEMVRRFSVETLEEAGYRVLEAEDGSHALALLSEHPDIRVLFTDVVLGGGMNGRRLADQAVAGRPALRVLFTTGYTPDAIVHRGRLDEGVNFLGKPFSAAALIAKVEAILAE